MDLEEDYIIYSLQTILTFMAVSVTYFADISRPITLLTLLPSTILFGYTAYISREGFRTHTLVSILALIFVLLGGITAAAAVMITTINILVSVFSSGSAFKDFYGSTSIPLLFTGLLMGALVFGLAISSGSFAKQVQGSVAEISGDQAESVANRSNILTSQKGKQSRIVNATSNTTFRLTRATVLRYMARNTTVDNQEYRALEDSFDKAEKDVKFRLQSTTASRIDEKSIDISSRVSDLVRNTLTGKTFILLVPAVTFGLYSVHPFVGILTAIWASLFSFLNVRFLKHTDSKDLENSL